MAVSDAYATAETYRAILEKSDSSKDDEILVDLKAVSRLLDRKLNRFFTQEPAVTRTYMPKPQGPARFGWAEAENPFVAGGLARVLYIDDLVSVTTIKIDEDRDGVFGDETALVAADFELLPRNAPLGSDPAPYSSIELTEWGAKNAFTPGALVEVIGTWGWPAVPGPIASATVHLTGILRLETPRATRRIQESMDSSFETSRAATDIIGELVRNYRRVQL